MNLLQSLFGAGTKKYKDARADEFLKLLGETQNTVLLDVRTPAEFAGGKVKGAVNLDIYNPNFSASIDKLNKNKTYFVYCRSGARSGQACNLMADRGFENLYNLVGGISSL
ncbi:MAG: rhodanese-like domain-containing protein [Saprospiraceae bacterium]|nr:rhodanese-like domain-containing protein [Saprospiraceae bacterium]MDZ4704826.1 rhodanese-like domain-containing protein [Saprospiraceae bacterium]